MRQVLHRWLPSRPRSLRGQLVALLAVLVFPVIALQGYWGYREYRNASEHAGLDALALADATSVSIQQLLAITEAVLSELATNYLPVAGTAEGCATVQALGSMFPFFTNVAATDQYGTVLCTTRSALPDPSTPVSPSFLTAREGLDFAVGSPVDDSGNGTWIVPLTLPLIDAQGHFAGSLVATVPLLEFQEILAGVPLEQGNLVTIATSERIVLARSTDADQWVGRPLPQPTSGAPQNEPQRAISVGPDFDGIRRDWGQVTVPGPEWTVYAGVQASLAAGSALMVALQHIGLSALVLMLGVLFGLRFYQDIARALRQLVEAVDVAHDRKHVSLPLGTPTEVCDVVKQFNLVVDRFDESLGARSRAEAAEHDSRARHESIFNHATFGVYVSTLDGHFIEVNPAFVAMLGYETREALLAAGPAALYPDPSFRVTLMDAYLDRGTIKDLAVDWLREDGSPISVRLNGQVIRATTGETAFEMFVEDVTETKRREDEHRHTQRMEAVGKFTGGIAHDFNNLLTVITGNLEFALEGLQADDPARKDVAQADAAATRAAALIAQLMSFSRKKPAAVRDIDLNDVVAHMENMFARIAGGQVTITTTLANDPPLLVRADPAQIEQILMNLVLNARDALPDGGLITLRTGRQTRQRGTETVDGVSLWVTDDGHGMPETTRARIFEPFFTTKPEGSGTGLGLATVHDIVKKAGGDIDVKSVLRDGTSFELWFPSPTAKVDGIDDGEALVSASLGGDETVLLVEDEVLLGLFVRRALERFGYRVLLASDGEEALATFHDFEGTIDLVVTDVQLPHLGGRHLAEHVRFHNPETPILFVSGHAGAPQHLRESVAGPQEFLAKPFHAVELCALVRRLLDQRVSGTLTG